ncbi:MAG: hypothetical protein WCK15_24940, partial [Pirellula sp.]
DNRSTLFGAIRMDETMKVTFNAFFKPMQPESKKGRRDHIGCADRGIFPTKHIMHHPETPKLQTSVW